MDYVASCDPGEKCTSETPRQAAPAGNLDVHGAQHTAQRHDMPSYFVASPSPPAAASRGLAPGPVRGRTCLTWMRGPSCHDSRLPPPPLANLEPRWSGPCPNDRARRLRCMSVVTSHRSSGCTLARSHRGPSRVDATSMEVTCGSLCGWEGVSSPESLVRSCRCGCVIEPPHLALCSCSKMSTPALLYQRHPSCDLHQSQHSKYRRFFF